MKKNSISDSPLPTSDKSADGHDAADTGELPVLPGTEASRSLGDMLREAELTLAEERSVAGAQAQQAAANAQAKRVGARQTDGNPQKRIKKVSRSQARRHARERALQALYQWDVSDGQISEIREQFLTDQDMSRVDVAYFIILFNGVSHHPQATDDALADALDRPITDLDPIERSVLRIAAYELTQCPDIPARVVINEGIEITKRFGADKGHRYVNGVLDKLAAAVRPLEMKRR